MGYISQNTQHTKIFIAHAPEDKAALEMLLVELDELKTEQPIEYWHSDMMAEGSLGRDLIRSEVKKADVIIMLHSDNFLKFSVHTSTTQNPINP